MNKELVTDIIAKSLIADLPNNHEYVSLCQANENNPIFNSFCDKVINEKTSFEERVFSQINSKSMLREALIILSQRKSRDQKEEFEIQKIFVEKLVLSDCNQKQKDYYQEILCLFGNCEIDYFLSFTNRKPNPNENNMVHINHKHFIKFVLNLSKPDFEKEIRSAEKQNVNLLAKAVNKLISQKLKGFYYPYHQGDNGNTMVKLQKGCNSSFAFIQLIQDIIFNHDPHRPNYCHYEYENIKGCIPEERRFFILAENREDIREKADLHPQFEKWYDEYCKNDPVHLKNSINYVQKELDEAKDLIETKITKSIKILRQKVFDDVPD